MRTPIVNEKLIAGHPVTRDDFADPRPGERRFELPSQRDLVVLALLRGAKPRR
jgi:hypothetical protein